MSSSSSRRPRVHSAQFKAKVLAACNQPDACIKDVASKHGVHVNLVHKWRGKAKGLALPKSRRVVQSKKSHFIAVPLKPVSPSEQLVVQVRRGGMEVVMYWPISHAVQCLQSLLSGCDDEA